jgi:signal transduction histidine kinase
VIQQEPWERRESALLRVLPVPLLVISVLITALQPWEPSLPGTLVISAAAGAWVLTLDTLRPLWMPEPPRWLPVVFFLGMLAFATVLILRAPWYGIFGFSCYVKAFEYLSGRWRFLAVAVVAVLEATSQIGGMNGIRSAGAPSFGLLILMNMLLSGAFTYFGWRTAERDEKRRATLAELAEANAKLESALAENAGLHAQLLAQAREAGVLDERQRMAREIHDTLAQGLTGIITQLEAAEQARGNPAEWQRHLDTAVRLARENLSEARRSVHAVRPEALENARLPEALADVVRRWSEINGVAAEVTTTGTARPTHPDVEVTLLRTAQEALANVAKHAAASRVGLTLSYMDDLVTLDVRDDGVGFSRTNGSGFGLTSMRQRVEGIAGQLEIESEPGRGTAISASIPIGG